MKKIEEDKFQDKPIEKFLMTMPWKKVLFWAVIFLLLFNSFYIVQAGNRALILTLGNPSMDAKGEGLNFKIPFVQKAIIMEVKTQKYEVESTAASKDLQDTKTKIAINYHLLPSSVPTIYTEIGLDYSNKIIAPMEQESLKAVTAQFTAEELITNREMVREGIRDLLRTKLEPRGIIVEEISIINFEFSESFTKAIEEKVTAEQNALREKNKLSQIQYEAQQRVAQSEGEARAIQIQIEAIRAQGGAEYIQLQWIARWNGIMPQVIVGDGGSVIPFLNLGNSTLG